MSTEAVAGRVVLDRYELIETLGTGPMGPVWRAHDRSLQRQVAIREIELPDILDDADQAALAEKVLREASAASRLDHPAAVTVLDVVTEAGQPFVVSELVKARTLADAVDSDGPLDPDHAAMLGLRVLDALTAAHQLGLVHRDVRPSNVLLTGSGVRLADFGVASMVDDPRITGGAMHEPSYLAPEQTESAGATALSDLWSLGATLYFAVEGVPPFSGGTPAATIAAIVNEAPRPTQRAGSLQPTLDALLVKDAMDRPDDDVTRALLATAAGDLGGAAHAPAPSAVPPTDRLPLGTDLVDGPGGYEPAAVNGAHAAVDGPAQTPDWATDGSPTAWATDDRTETAPPGTSADPVWSPSPPAPATDPDTAWASDPVASDPVAVDSLPVDPVAVDPVATGAVAADALAPDTAAVDALAAHDLTAAHEPVPVADDAGCEPWFFQVPAETVAPPPLPEPPPRPEVEPERPPGRFPRGLWAALLAALIAGVMIALIVTGGHTLRAQRPTIDRSKGSGAVSSWVPYTDAITGFTIRYPASWSVRRNGSQTFFVDPAGISYLEVDHQQPPAPSLTGSAFEQEKSFSASHPNYKRIGIEETSYQDKPSALWQFTYAEGGTNIRAADVLVNSPKYGFALFFQARADDWPKAQVTFDNFKSVFGMPA